MNILFISAYAPSRIRVRPYNFIKALARRSHAVTLICGVTPADSAALDELRPVCQRIVAVPISKTNMALNALRALPGKLPFQAALSFGAPLLEAVRAESRRTRYDVAHIEHLRASALRSAVQGIPVVLDAVDCISLLFERAQHAAPLRARAMTLLDLARTRRYEAHYTKRFDQVLVTSPEDAWAIAELQNLEMEDAEQQYSYRSQAAMLQPQRLWNGSAGSEIAIIPNGVDLDYFAPQRVAHHPATLVFSGKMSYHANVAAALFLGRTIMPRVWAARSTVRLVIAGSAPTREVQALAADPRIIVTGYVDDLRPYIAQSAVAVAPLRYGVGIQNKVLEAMALETPVVAARQVAQSLQAEPGADLLLAEDAAEYAQAILALLDDPIWQTRLGQAGRRYVERYHNWNSAAAQIEHIYAAVTAQRHNGHFIHA
ncbi:MAG: glycosyltransferase [Chloroflexales bacterium]|nr:glycosyltransferase [Chloroflexales bacterium]